MFYSYFLFLLEASECVLLAIADCYANTDKSAEILILSCTAETRQLPIAIGTI